MSSLQTASTTESNGYSKLYNLANEPSELHGFWHYITTLSIGILYFTLLHGLVDVVLKRRQSLYRILTYKQKAEYRNHIIQPIHCVVACSLSIWGMFFVCESGNNVFNDQQCFNTPRNIHIWCLTHTCAQFTVDLYNWAIIRRDFNVELRPMYVHHILSIITFYFTVYMNNFTTVFGTMLVFVEISTIFLCIRWLYFKHNMGRSSMASVNSLVFVLSFFFSRIVFQIFIVFCYGLPGVITQIKTDDTLTNTQLVFYVEMILLLILSIGINSYWMFTIIQQAYRAIIRLKDTDTESYSKISHDAEMSLGSTDDNTFKRLDERCILSQGALSNVEELQDEINNSQLYSD